MISIYENQHGKISQLEGENSLMISFQGSEYKLRICSFIALRAKLERIDIVEMLLSDARHDAIEIISVCHSDHLLVLTLDEVLALKDLLSGTMALMELNSIVHQRLHRALV